MNLVTEYTEALSKRLAAETGRPPDPAPALDPGNVMPSGNQPKISGNQPSQLGNQPTICGTGPTQPGTQPNIRGTQPNISGNQPVQPGNQPNDPSKEPSVPGSEPKLLDRPVEGNNHFIRGGSIESDLQIRAIEQNVALSNVLGGKHNVTMSNVLGGSHLSATIVTNTENMQPIGNVQLTGSSHQSQTNVGQLNSSISAPVQVHGSGVISATSSAHIAHVSAPQGALGNTHSAPLSTVHHSTLSASAPVMTSSHVTNIAANQASVPPHVSTNQTPGHPGTHTPGSIPGNVPYFYPGMVPGAFLPSPSSSGGTGRGYIPPNAGSDLSLRDLHHFTQLS